MKEKLEQLLKMLREIKTNIEEHENDLNDIPFDPLVTDFNTMIECAEAIEEDVLRGKYLVTVTKSRLNERGNHVGELKDFATVFIDEEHNLPGAKEYFDHVRKQNTTYSAVLCKIVDATEPQYL